MKTAKVSPGEYETLAELRYALRQFLHFSESCAETAGIAPQQHQALLAIKGFRGDSPITVSDLAERLQIRHHSAVGLVNRLVVNGYIRRKSNPADRRQIHLALTGRSEAMLGKLSAAHKEQLRRMGPQIETLLKRLRG